MRIACLVSRYPLLSHTFIMREVLALRRAGTQVDTFTVRRAGDGHLLTEVDREADATTFAIVPPRIGALGGAHLRAFARHPGRYLATLRLALELRGPGARSALWQVFYFGESAVMWDECRRRGITHIHAHHANVASDVALLAASLGGPAWSWSFTMHGSTEFFDVREHRLPQKVERALFVRCVSDHGRSQLMSLVGTEHWEKLHVVHCGVDVAEFTADDHPREPNPAPEILTVGRVVPVKGQALLVEALAELASRGIDARLTIVGDGPQLPELRERAQRLGIADRVAFEGAVGQDAVRGYYERADVFALPSFAEGLPVVLIEAMAMGLPVVASRITGIPELVEEGISGRLVVPGRGDQLVDALAALASASDDERRAMGRSGRDRVVAEFDVRDTALELRSLLERILA